MPFLETILVDEGKTPFLKWHQQRLERTLRRHNLPVSYDLQERLTPPGSGRWRCRVVYDEHTLHIEYLPYTPRTIASLRLVEDNTIVYMDKTTERGVLNALFALRGTADDVLLVQNGLLTDTTTANVACFIDGKWLTPKRPLLEGTARARFLAEGKLLKADITPDAALSAERIAVMNALSGFVEVSGGIIHATNPNLKG
ncbi:MAG TPA: hypothetical protein ENL04_01845 [Sulfuricurvum sp.]|nr:hypothetical protein [Sulfuricurvum sp.]